jgi:hypothetical protein
MLAAYIGKPTIPETKAHFKPILAINEVPKIQMTN